ncbi:MAG: HNH endonuclease [Eubacterium sp.]
MTSDFLPTIIIFIILFILLMVLVMSCYANTYIKKHGLEIFSINKPISDTCQSLATLLKQQQGTYQNYLSNMGLNQTYRCSSSVLSNAENKPLKYLIKYSNVDYSMQCLEQLEFCACYLQSLSDFHKISNQLYTQALKQIPSMVGIFVSKKKFFSIVCGIYDISSFRKGNASFRFLYISPAGKSQREFKIKITTEIIQKLQSEISYKLNKNSQIKTQRNAMNNDLRNAIKKRDNYTCCICGNSIYNEPNLLLEVDHIIPIAKGGKTEASNLQTLCWRCNRLKSDK